MNDFKASINTKFDLGSQALINNYVPTTVHLPALENILVSANSAGHQNSHLIIGAYGTGKSYLAAIASGLLAGKYSAEDRVKLSEKIKNLSFESPAVELIVNEGERTYLPVPLSGYEGSFREAILNAVIRVLKENNVPVDIPGQGQQILTIMERWQNHFPAAYAELQKRLAYLEYESIEAFAEQIRKESKEALQDFREIYEALTFGESLSYDSKNQNFIATMTKLLEDLSKINQGIFLLYDEFGRFLQSLPDDEIYRTMQDLQDLAELANNGSDNLELMIISHKDLNSYFASFSDSYREEFKRIEGRFRTYFIKSDQNVFASIVSLLMSELIPDRIIASNVVDQLNQGMMSYSLFDLSAADVERLIVKGAYPIHPVTLYLLSVLSSRFGQNERTLYTFFSDSRGINKFLRESFSSELMYPDFLYNYFFSEEETDAELLRIRKAIDKNLFFIRTADLENRDIKNLEHIYLFISLWEIAELRDKQRLTSDFVSFAVGLPKAVVEDSLAFLSEIGVLRYNSRFGYYETKEVCSIDVKAIIDDLEENVQAENGYYEKKLQDLLPGRFVKAHEYNRQKAMVRYGKKYFHLLQSGEDFRNILLDPEVDAAVHYLVVDRSSVDFGDIEALIQDYAEPRQIYCLTEIDSTEIKREVRKLKAASDLMNQTSFLRENPDAADELKFLTEDITLRIQKLMYSVLSFSGANRWFVRGRRQDISSETQLSEAVSDLMLEVYPKTPRVLNESFNKRKVSAVQKKAAIKVIDAIFENQPIEGNGPDFMIYYSVFQANGFNPFEMDNKESRLSAMEADLKQFLAEEASITRILEFFQLEEFGYGLRFSLIPVLFAGLLKDVWDNLLFFNQGSAVMNMNGENLFKMFEHPEGYSFKFHTYTEKQTETISEILHRYSFAEEDRGKPNHMKAGHGLYLWLKSLPRYAQISFEADPSLTELRDAINYFSVDPIGSIDRLGEIGIDQITDRRFALDSFVLDKEREIQRKIYSDFQVDSFEDLRQEIQKSPEINRLTSRFARVVETGSEETLVDDLSQELLGIQIGQWSDNTRIVFEKELRKDFSLLKKEPDLENRVVLEVAGKKQIIEKGEALSHQADNLSKRINAMIYAQHQRVSKDEIKLVLYDILSQMMEEEEPNG